MMKQESHHKWSVWINKTKKIISFKEVPEAQKISFENRDIGIKTVSALTAKGYKVG